MDSRGEMGAGTLVIFIALVLVAAIAAGVSLQTTAHLQQKALNTGKQGVTSITTAVRVIEITGSDGTGTLENLTMLLALAPGSEPIDFSKSLLFVSVNHSTTYLYSGGAIATVNATAENGTFGVSYLQESANHIDGLLSRGDVARIDVRMAVPLESNDQVQLRFLPQQGHASTVTITMPSYAPSQMVYLYP